MEQLKNNIVTYGLAFNVIATLFYVVGTCLLFSQVYVYGQYYAGVNMDRIIFSIYSFVLGNSTLAIKKEYSN